LVKPVERLTISLTGPQGCGKTRWAAAIQGMSDGGVLGDMPAPTIIDNPAPEPPPEGAALALMALEFGWRHHEKGYNLQAAMEAFAKVIRG